VEKTFPEQNISCKPRFPLPQSNPRLFILLLFLRLRVKKWNWNWDKQKRIDIPVFIKELGKRIKKKFNKYVNIKN